MKVLATGATGKFAHHVVPALVASGIEVRALIHDPGKADAARQAGAGEVAVGDLADPQTLAAALQGADGAFLITPAFHPQATQLGLNLITAAQTANVGQVVYNGVYHPSLSLVNHASTRPIEEALYASDLDFTVLQPAMYMQGIEPAYRRALQTGKLVFPWSKHSKMTYVDYRDVAYVAAIAFADGSLSRGTFELAAGPMIDRVEIAALMSEAAGRELVAENLPRPPGDQPVGPAAMFADYDRHGFHGGNPLVLATILGHEPRSIAEYITELGQADSPTPSP